MGLGQYLAHADRRADAEQLVIRGPRSTDQAYIASTWVRSMTSAGHRKLGARGGHVARHIDSIFDRDDTRALIRHVAGDPDRIIGWLVRAEGAAVPLVHYVYVRKDYRGKGHATELLLAAGCRKDLALVYTCDGPDSRHLVTAYPAATHLPLTQFLSPS